jgi:hypothetical protein
MYCNVKENLQCCNLSLRDGADSGVPNQDSDDPKPAGKRDSQATKNRPKFGEFGWFLDGCSNGFQQDVQPPDTADDDDLKRAWDRYKAPGRAKQALEENQKLRDDNAALKKKIGRKPASQLESFVTMAKRKNPSRESNHRFLARYVDGLCEKRGIELKKVIELKDICPRNWLNAVPAGKFPRLFVDALKHPRLSNRAKVLISKAPKFL